MPIYLIVGVPGSGKTWVCKQLTAKFDYLPHDDFPNPKAYIAAIKRLSSFATKPILIETPFSVSQYMESLNVIPVFIIETPEITKNRYETRDNKPIPQGHLSRINTYIERANELKAFKGTSQEVLDHFCGSGTTGVAAQNNGFNFVGIEMTPEYVQIAEKRLKLI